MNRDSPFLESREKKMKVSRIPKLIINTARSQPLISASSCQFLGAPAVTHVSITDSEATNEHQRHLHGIAPTSNQLPKNMGPWSHFCFGQSGVTENGLYPK